MNDETNYKNNPLHGVGLKSMLSQLVDHYGFELLNAYLNINSFKTNPSIQSSLKFLKKEDWAREKVEAFYLYEFKNLPRASSEQFFLPPRDRIIPEDQKPGEPAELSVEDGYRLRDKREKKFTSRGQSSGQSSRGAYGQRERNKKNDNPDRRARNASGSSDSKGSDGGKVDPWAKARNR